MDYLEYLWHPGTLGYSWCFLFEFSFRPLKDPDRPVGKDVQKLPPDHNAMEYRPEKTEG